MSTSIKYKDILYTTGNNISFKAENITKKDGTVVFAVHVYNSDVNTFDLEYLTLSEREHVIETITRCLGGYLDLDDIDNSREGGSGAGGGKIREGFVVQTAVGNLMIGDEIGGKKATEVLETMLGTPDVKPGATLTLTPSTTLYENGYVLNDLQIKCTYTKKDSNLKSFTLTVGGVQVLNKSISSSGSTTYTHTNPITNTTAILLNVYDQDKLPGTDSKTISFTDYRYWGLVSGSKTLATLTEEDIKGLSHKELSTSKSLTDESTYNLQKLVFAYNNSSGPVSTIKDGNGFDVRGTFDNTTMNITNQYGVTTTYRVYMMNVTNSGTLKYIFA